MKSTAYIKCYIHIFNIIIINLVYNFTILYCFILFIYLVNTTLLYKLQININHLTCSLITCKL